MLIVKVGYRQAVVHGIIRCLAELAGSGIIELQFLRQESASGLAGTGITRYGVVGVRILATLFYLFVIPSKHKII